MKKMSLMQITLLLFAVLVCESGKGQNVFPTPSGNVGIGITSSLTEKLHVLGNIKLNQSNSGLIFYGGGEKIIGTSDYGIQFQTQNGTPRMTISNAGNVTIGTQAPIFG